MLVYAFSLAILYGLSCVGVLFGCLFMQQIGIGASAIITLHQYMINSFFCFLPKLLCSRFFMQSLLVLL